MGNTRNTGYLQNIVQYDASNNIILPSLIGTGTRMVVSSSTGLLSTQEILTYVSQIKHQVKLGATIAAGTPVYVSGSTGNSGTNMIVSKASNAAESTSSKTLGLTATGGVTNDIVFVITEGLLSGLDTSTANAGDPVWLGVNGALIFGLLNKPVAPAHLVFIGVVTRAQQNNGEIFVKVQNGFELDELHDLSVKNASDGDMIKYVASTGLWTKIAASTTNITEGTNLYYTDTRVGTYLTANSYATQTYVNTAVSNLVDAAPGTLDTLNELAAALGDDPNFATTVATSIGTKVPNARTITINGTAYDLSADRSWTIAGGGSDATKLPLAGGTMTGQITWSSATAAISFQQGGNSGTYTQTTIYANQNNTSGDINNGIFIERGYTDTSNTEVRHFVIGARGGSYQWKLSGAGGTFQRDACEVKPAADGNLFIGRFSAGSATLFKVYQSGSDGYLELQTGAGDIVTKLSGYGGVANFTTTNFGFGKSSGISYKIDAYSGGGQVARFATNQSGAAAGQCAEFINSSASGYASWIYIGSAPGTDWKIGKNISNPTNTTYHFEIVDSSNNLRLQINNSTGNATFSSDIIAYSDRRLKKNIRSINNSLSKVLDVSGVLYDRIDTSEINTFGFIAQDLEVIFPELVTTNDLGIKGVKYQNMVPILVEAIKEQQTQIEFQKTEIEELKDLVKQLINK